MTPPIDTLPITQPLRPRRKRLSFSLRVMMLLVLAAGAATGWIAYRVRVQREAVAAIREARGGVLFNGADPRRGKSSAAGFPQWKWIRTALGNDVFDTVTSVSVVDDRVDDRLMAHIGRLEHLESLTLPGYILNRPLNPGLTAEGMSQIRHLARLKVLIAGGPRELRGFLPYVGLQRQLRVLQMPRASATDEDMVRIGELTELETLCLDGRNVTNEGFSKLTKLTKLKDLSLPNFVVTDLTPAAGMNQLGHLQVGHARRTYSRPLLKKSVNLEPLIGKKSLVMVFLGDTPTDDENLRVTTTLPVLRFFGASGRGITDKGLATLGESKGLVSVFLPDTSITDDGLVHLSKSPVLSYLYLNGSKVAGRGLSHLASLKMLKGLDLGHTALTDAGMASVATITSLRVLNLRGTQITDDGLARLAPLAALCDLVLDDTCITDAGLVHLTSNSGLVSVSLRRTKVSDAGIASLEQLPSLSLLRIHGTRISDAGIARLKAKFRRITIETAPGDDRPED